MTIKKEIIYPVFLECCQFAEDTFWENIFEELAYGKCPYGTYINKSFLCCNYKGKEFSYKLERKDPLILYNDLYNLLTIKLGILSQKEKQKKRLDFHYIEKCIKNSQQNWKDIRKKNIKDLLIERYVIEMRKKHSLTIKQAKYLLSIIFFAIVFKIITVKDISYDDSRITHIDGIEVNDKKIILKKNIYNIIVGGVMLPEDSVTPPKTMSDNWGKYIKQLKKIDT
jgi:hypothetical protein